MNKLFISIIALAALSGTAYANNHGSEMRDSDFYNVKKPTASATMTVVSPLAITEKDAVLSAFERMKKISEQNEKGGHSR